MFWNLLERCGPPRFKSSASRAIRDEPRLMESPRAGGPDLGLAALNHIHDEGAPSFRVLCERVGSENAMGATCMRVPHPSRVLCERVGPLADIAGAAHRIHSKPFATTRRPAMIPSRPHLRPTRILPGRRLRTRKRGVESIMGLGQINLPTRAASAPPLPKPKPQSWASHLD
jgi:hypothetical protein